MDTLTGSYLQIRKAKIFYETAGLWNLFYYCIVDLAQMMISSIRYPNLREAFRVIAFERPGHGRSAGVYVQFSFNSMAAGTTEIIEKLGLGPTNPCWME